MVDLGNGTHSSAVLQMDYNALRRYLPIVIGNIGIYYDENINTWYWPELDDVFQYMVWVLVCYNFKINHGARPSVPGVVVPTRIRTTVKTFECPFCGRTAKVEHFEDDSVRARQYLVWLAAHFAGYHNWFSVTQLWQGYQKEVKEALDHYLSTIKSRVSEITQYDKDRNKRAKNLVQKEKRLAKQKPHREY